MHVAYYLLAATIGAIAAIYLSLNARFAEQVGSLPFAVLVFFSVAAVTAGAVYLLQGAPVGLLRLGEVDPPLFALGILSCLIILCTTFVIPKIGPCAFFVGMIAGEVTIGLLMSHFGWIAPQQFPITPLKVVGALAVVGGVMLIRWEENGQMEASLHMDSPAMVAENTPNNRD